MRERCLDCSIKALGVDLLHKKVTLHRRILYRSPPYSPGIVDDHIKMAINLGIVSSKNLRRIDS
jgi:hypothetical protein